MNLHQFRIQRQCALDRLQRFADMVLSDGMKRGREIVVGRISREVLVDLRTKGIVLETAAVIIDDAVIVKYISHVKGMKGAVINPRRYWMVAEAVMRPTHIYEDTAQKYLVYLNTRNYERGRVLKVIIHPNYKIKGRTINYVKSIGVVNEEDMLGRQFRRLK